MALKKKTVRAVRNSNYLLTNLYQTSYFNQINQSLIIAYLIPFADSNDHPYEDTPEDLRRKQNDIENNLLGVAANYASQGFTFGLLHRTHITFPYYYARLEKLDAYIRNHSTSYVDIESRCLSGELDDILSKPALYFKREHEVRREDRDILRGHLSQHGNRFVLAELLYYITAKDHHLPAVNEQYFDLMRNDIPARLLAANTVPMRTRSSFDEDADAMRRKLSKVKTFRLLCFNGSSFFDAGGATGTNTFFRLLLERLREDAPIEMEIILGEPGSAANAETASCKIAPYHAYTAKKLLAGNSLAGIKLLRERSGVPVHAKTTKLFLPYAINIYRFFDSKLDYLKVDLYSPYVSNNGQRPSMIVFRIVEPDLFEHFDTVFNRVWNDEDNSTFV